MNNKEMQEHLLCQEIDSNLSDKNEKYQEIVKNYPKLFNKNTFLFECYIGWFDIINDLCKNIYPYITDNMHVVQIKEKFGGLRFYMRGYNEIIDSFIQKAEDLSVHTCEKCGQPGTQLKSGWILTLCDKHMKEEIERRKG
jgi:hypothetical protein